MNRLLPPFLLLTLLVCFAAQPGHSQPAKTTGSATANRVEILDFHNEHRCPTCLEIERLTRKILKETYGEQAKKGLITFQLINVDDENNLAMVRKYKAYGSTLVIRSFKAGKEEFVDLTNFAFLNFNKEQKFTATIKKELNAALQRIKS